MVLERLAGEDIDETIVVDNGGDDETATVVKGAPGSVRLIVPGENLGIAGRNLGAREAVSELVLFLDDDSYPTPGAVRALAEPFARVPGLGAAGGLVRDVDGEGRVLRADDAGTFDWFLRGGRRGFPRDGFPAFFFPEGAAIVRRTAFLAVGGFFEPYFFTLSELDVSTRLIAAGWDVRYVPGAAFAHAKAAAGRTGVDRTLRLRVRNQVWYFWLRFPPALAARRIPAYLFAELLKCVDEGALGAWVGGIADAWRERDRVRPFRQPLPRGVIRRAELNRGRLHVRLFAQKARDRLLGTRRS